MRALLDGLLLFCIVLAGTSLVSMMGVFMGSSHPALGPLLRWQLVGSAVALVMVIAVLWVFARNGGLIGAFREIAARQPGWLLFVLASLLSLVVLGELSFFLVFRVGGRITPLVEHAPLLAALTGSLAFCAVYALTERRDED